MPLPRPSSSPPRVHLEPDVPSHTPVARPPPTHARPVDAVAALLTRGGPDAPALAWSGPAWHRAPSPPEPPSACLARVESWLAQARASRPGQPLPVLHDPQGQAAWRASDLLAAAAQDGAQGLILDTAPCTPSPLPSPLSLGVPAGLHGYTPALAVEALALLTQLLQRWQQGQPIGLVHLRVLPHAMPAPSLPRSFAAGMQRGLYPLVADPAERAVRLQLLASGASLAPALDAAVLLRERHGLAVDVWSVTSYPILAREARQTQPPADAWLARQLGRHAGPILAVAEGPGVIAQALQPVLAHERACAVLGSDALPAGLAWTDYAPATQAVLGAALALCAQALRQQENGQQQQWSALASMGAI